MITAENATVTDTKIFKNISSRYTQIIKIEKRMQRFFETSGSVLVCLFSFASIVTGAPVTQIWA